MAGGALKLRLLSNRNRLELRIGAASAELTADDIDNLWAELHRMGEALRFATGDDADAGGRRPAEKLLALLRLYDRVGGMIPPNRDLQARLECRDENTIRRALAELERAGLIRVEQLPGHGRKVTVVDTRAGVVLPVGGIGPAPFIEAAE